MLEFLTLMWGYIATGMALGFGIAMGVIAAMGFHRFCNAYFMFYIVSPLLAKIHLWRMKK
ncbi:TPA: hypothetical protein ACKRTE_001015 [Providencia rettgeri]